MGGGLIEWLAWPALRLRHQDQIPDGGKSLGPQVPSMWRTVILRFNERFTRCKHQGRCKNLERPYGMEGVGGGCGAIREYLTSADTNLTPGLAPWVMVVSW